ncbi:distal membrane-arm assembly complex protein 2 [Belonocnema kinseyi]|uniref:distal membrane-arm assembly complex protein 2 n=1 Tax=Belonocnema kinseyi TaxID=2817044 RepID=UPI00143D5B6B|nr:distal membrane-arm assembly complex protein 2 [Belonocnema kinseyi]
MFIRKAARFAEKADPKSTSLTPILRHFCLRIDDSPVKRQERKLRQWRKMPDRSPQSFLALWDKSAMAPKAKRDRSFGNLERGEEIDFSIAGIKRFFAEAKVDFKKDNQKFIKERLEILGADLAAAHFLLFRGGKVRFRGHTAWMKPEDYPHLPTVFDAKYILDAIDCTGMELFYEGLLNLENLTRVKWVSFRGNPVFDEWCLDRIVGQMPRLEYLDVSDCPKLNERGLEALYKLFNLKTLIVTNHQKSAAFELTCMMLGDCNPNLNYEILEPGEESKLSVFEAQSKRETEAKV